MIEKNELTAIGKFLKTHALKGELNAVLEVDADCLDKEYPVIIEIDGIFVPFYIDSLRPKGQFASLIKLDNVDTEEDAKPFVNKTIYMLTADLPEDDNPSEGGYADDFIGYSVFDTEKAKIGVIEDVDLSTQNALFIVVADDGSTVYIPINEDFIDFIDVDKQEIVMNLPEGLINLNPAKRKE